MNMSTNRSNMWRHGVESVLAVLVILLTWAAPAMAQEAADDYLEPRVTRTQFAALCGPLQLGREQRNITELAFSDYTTELADLAQQLNAKANEAGRQTANDALAGKARVAPDELKRIRAAVLKIYEQGFSTVDESLNTLLASVSSVLTPDQTPEFDRGVRALHRDIYLHPRQAASDYPEYAGDGVDLILLAQAASQDGGELQSVDPNALQEILSAYEMQLDSYLVQTAPGYRQGKLARKIATIEKDSATLRSEEQASLQRWKSLYELNQHAKELIGNLILASHGETGAQARQQWLDRVEKASFTWLFPRKKPDREMDWMRQQQLPEATMQKATEIYDQYLSKRKALSSKAIELMIRGRLEFQTILYSMMDPTVLDERVRRGIYDELLKNTGEQATLESNTAGTLEALLTDSQRQSLRDVLKKPEPAPRRK